MSEFNAANLGVDNLESPPDRYTLTPFYALAVLWIVAVVPTVFEPGNLFFPATFVPAVLILPIAGVVWLAALIISSIRFRWRRAASLLGAAVLFSTLSLLTIRFQDEFCFWILSPYYYAQIEQIRANPKQTSFPWRGGLGWETRLTYDETDAYAPLPSAVARLKSEESCTRKIRRLYKHFYLDELTCQGS